MEDKTLKALVKEIKKWEAIAAGEGADVDNCLLCELFAEDCEGCPIYIKTHLRGCVNTPYDDWVGHQEHSHSRPGKKFFEIECPECERIACEQLEFLKSLLSELLSENEKQKEIMVKKNNVQKKPFEGCFRVGKNKFTDESFHDISDEDDKKFSRLLKKLQSARKI